MRIELTASQREAQEKFRDFVQSEVVPQADRFDREEKVSAEIIQRIAQRGYLGASVPAQYGGMGLSMVTCGLLHEEFGSGCSSLRSLLTVHGMVCHTLHKWGSKAQKEHLLPLLARGELIAAFGLTEPEAGSDAGSIETSAQEVDGGYLLNGRKKWITFGQIADLFLVFARCERGPAAFLLPRETPGLKITPIQGMLGVRASMLAQLDLDDCKVPKDNLVGRVGFGVSYLASSALSYGRYSVAWGCVGIAQACLDACFNYIGQRRQFGLYLKDHQLIQQMMTEMITGIKAARLLCLQAGYAKDEGEPEEIMEAMIAKYFAARLANQAARDAVQIHGANGCCSDFPVQRYLRDAKIMEIIEGSTQIQQITIARYAERREG